jgi:hypothetical protein
VTTTPLVLGPLVRYVDATDASIWVETDRAAVVAVRIADRSWEARTFAVHGHHYALVEVSGLEPGTVSPYTVEVDGARAWPLDAAGAEARPPSVIATLAPERPLRLAYGSCRTSIGHDEAGNARFGVDALRAYALHLAHADRTRWPDLLLFLGDQVYADESTAEMEAFMASRRDLAQPPFDEIKDYQEYAHLYRLAWSDPDTRWLLSTLPTSMIFDDHDVRDDWNTSQAWREEMEATSWWHERIVSGLASYWVYQHLGNLAPAERVGDELYGRIAAAQAQDEELDLSETLDAFAERVDREPASYRWSHARDLGDARLVVVDSRAARVLDPAQRSMLHPGAKRWLDEEMRGGCRHLLVATSIPYLLYPGLHHLEAWDEALVAGAWGRLGARLGEKLRRFVDLEHWAAFRRDFHDVAQMAVSVACGERGTAPETVTFLSGDVHHSYLCEVDRVHGRPREELRSRIVQAVCSPIRNRLPGFMRFALVVMSVGLAGPPAAAVAWLARVPRRPFTWRSTRRPWFDNNVALLECTDDGLALSWHTGVVEDSDPGHPALREVEAVLLEPGPRR